MRKVKTVLTSLAKNVHTNEQGCVKYLVLEQTSADSDNPGMVLIEEYAVSCFPRFVEQKVAHCSNCCVRTDGDRKQILTNTTSSNT